MSGRLYHYTCAHGYQEIEAADWWLRPNRGVVGGALIWLTDMAPPDRRALGLTSMILSCDRSEYPIRCSA